YFAGSTIGSSERKLGRARGVRVVIALAVNCGDSTDDIRLVERCGDGLRVGDFPHALLEREKIVGLVIAASFTKALIRVPASPMKADEDVVLRRQVLDLAYVLVPRQERDLVRETGSGCLDLVIIIIVAFDERHERCWLLVSRATFAVAPL